MTVFDITAKAPGKRVLLLQDLDVTDSAILKALAITLILLHNFFHVVSPARQNEFSFSADRFTVFLQTIQQPSLAVQAFFSFFGHYGVQVFVFLSAYGLAKAHWDKQESWAAFMWGRIRKLYPSFLIIVGAWAFAKAVLLGPVAFLSHMGLPLALMLLGVSTLFGYGFPPVGPWWFIPFIVQFYAIWPLLRKLTCRFGWKVLLALSLISLVVTYFCNPLLSRWGLNLLFTPIGRIPVICMGIAAARYPLRLHRSVAALALAVLVLGSRYEPLWLLTLPAAPLVILWSYSWLRDSLRSFGWLRRVGEYSLLVFLLNAVVRDTLWGNFPLESIQMYARSPGMQLLFGCASAVLSFLFAALIYELLSSPVRAKARVPSTIQHVPAPPSHSLPRGARVSSARVLPQFVEQ